MKRDISNICASIYARLQNKARESNRPFSEILQYYGMERFLYRFSRSKYSDKFVLKGALMFMVWQLLERRTTLDIDFLACCDNRVTVIEMLIKDVCNVAVVSDGLRFDSQTVEGHKIKENADYEGDEIYDKNSDRQILWTAFLRKDDIKHAPNTLSDMAKEIEKFLLEPVIAIRKGIKFSKKWKFPGGWR